MKAVVTVWPLTLGFDESPCDAVGFPMLRLEALRAVSLTASESIPSHQYLRRGRLCSSCQQRRREAVVDSITPLDDVCPVPSPSLGGMLAGDGGARAPALTRYVARSYRSRSPSGAKPINRLRWRFASRRRLSGRSLGWPPW